MKTVLTCAALCLSGTYAAAQSISELIDDSVGYETIRAGVVMIETSTAGSFCKIDVADNTFEAAAAGEDTVGRGEIVCVPYDVFNSSLVTSDARSFTDYIDASAGYVQVREGVILVEESAVSSLCQITISDDDFARFSTEGRSGVQDARAICVPINELED